MKNAGAVEDIKIGIVGLDSSHAPRYTELLHESGHPHHVPGARVVAAYPGGSPDWELSYSRLPGFQRTLENEFGVPIFDSIDAVAEAADALMILSVDGRVHPAQFEVAARWEKPIYVDKPFACTLDGARDMAAWARQRNAPVFSSSVWRFAGGLPRAREAVGGVCHVADLHGMWPLHPGLHGWSFYGVHHIELLYALMGAGCRRVTCRQEGPHETITGFWPDDRVGTITTNHEKESPFGGQVTGAQGQAALLDLGDALLALYAAFLRQALGFFRGQPSPVPLSETCETIAFLESAWQSRRQNGVSVSLPRISTDEG